MDSTALDPLIVSYTAAWSEPDAAKRRQLLQTVWDAQGQYIDPFADVTGREALHALIGHFLADHPGTYFEVAGSIAHHHQSLRFFWKMKLADGTEIPGMDYGEVSPEGKLSKIVGFFQL